MGRKKDRRKWTPCSTFLNQPRCWNLTYNSQVPFFHSEVNFSSLLQKLSHSFLSLYYPDTVPSLLWVDDLSPRHSKKPPIFLKFSLQSTLIYLYLHLFLPSWNCYNQGVLIFLVIIYNPTCSCIARKLHYQIIPSLSCTFNVSL